MAQLSSIALLPPHLNMNGVDIKQLSSLGNWEFDLKENHLSWSESQFALYGYRKGEIQLNSDFFLQKTTHPSDLLRINSLIEKALKKENTYAFKRRIIKKNGTFGFAETKAKILRLDNGKPVKIIGTTENISGQQIGGNFNFCDPIFFESFYINYQKAVLNEIVKITSDKELAFDLCQEIFLKAWEHMMKYDLEKGKLFTWILAITKNHCKDYFRSKYSRFKKLSDPLNIYNQSEVVFQESSRETEYTKDLLAGLKNDQSELMNLLFIQGFSQLEVAKIKKLPLGTVKSKSRAAITELRKLAMNHKS